MAPLLADVSQSQALRLHQVECLARCSRAAVDASTCLSAADTIHSTDGGSAGISPRVYSDCEDRRCHAQRRRSHIRRRMLTQGIDCRGPLNGRGGRLKRSSFGSGAARSLCESVKSRARDVAGIVVIAR